MSTRERAELIFDALTEEQLAEFIDMFSERLWDEIEEVEPDEWDKKMIAASMADDGERISLDELIERLGIDPDDLRD